MEVPRPPESLLQKYNVPAPRYTSYPTAPMWTPSFRGADAARALENASQRADEPLSLYVHLPFCKSLCWYCGCNVVIAKESAAAEKYLAHLELELRLVARRLGARRSLSQVHFGGGTPTFLTNEQLRRLWGWITSEFTVAPGAEVAIEIHPALTSVEQLKTLREAGFNRLSMGLQDFDPDVQRVTNRIQTPEQTAALVDAARGLGFGGINFDLIYGLPEQTEPRWARTLEHVLRMQPDRLAVYGFAYLPETLKHQRRMPADKLPSGATRVELFRMAANAFLGAGYSSIGLDHFAKDTDELAIAARDGRLNRNFQGYTVQAAAEVVAVGSTGISDIGGAWAQNVRALPRYYERVEAGELATERGMWTSEDDRIRRRIITDVMCNLRVDLGDASAWQAELSALKPLRDDGLCEVNGAVVRVTELGRFFLRNVAMVFDAYVPKAGATRFSKAV